MPVSLLWCKRGRGEAWGRGHFSNLCSECNKLLKKFLFSSMLYIYALPIWEILPKWAISIYQELPKWAILPKQATPQNCPVRQYFPDGQCIISFPFGQYCPSGKIVTDCKLKHQNTQLQKTILIDRITIHPEPETLSFQTILIATVAGS